jgi:hypothetical protein
MWRSRGSPCQSREVISSWVFFFSAARLRSRFRRVAAFARSLSAKALRSRFITLPSSDRIATGDPRTVVPSRAEDAPGRVLPTNCLILCLVGPRFRGTLYVRHDGGRSGRGHKGG